MKMSWVRGPKDKVCGFEIIISGWTFSFDNSCIWYKFSRGETGWYWSFGPFFIESPDFSERHSN